MKTRMEKKYVDLVITMIMNSDKTMEEKERNIKRFFNDSSYFYENLCYNIYYLSLLPGTNVLTIDDLGVSYVNLKDPSSERTYHEILILNEFSPSCTDVITHIDVALNHLYELLYAAKAH